MDSTATPVPSASRSADPAPPPPAPVIPPPSPQPAPPVLHNPTPAELAAAKADNEKGIVHGSEARPPTDKKMTDMLPEKPPVKDGFVELGNLRVEAAKYSEFREAMVHV
jgi:hypothetical protein